MSSKAIEFSCPRCSAGPYYSTPEHLGKHIKCRICGSIIPIVQKVPLTTPPATSIRQAGTSGRRKSYYFRIATPLVIVCAIALLAIVFTRGTTSAQKQQTRAAATEPQSESVNPAVTPTRPTDSNIATTAATASSPTLPNDDYSIHSQSKRTSGRPSAYRSLPNGTRVEPDQAIAGLGQLTVNNGTSSDAVIRLVDNVTERSARWVYVRSGAVIKITGIEPGGYALRYTLGRDWDDVRKQFNVYATYYEFEKPLLYAESDEGKSTKFKSISVTLHPVPLGNARTATISRQKFLSGDNPTF